MAWMTLLNIGLRRYTLPPTQGWRQGAIKNRFWGWAIQDWGRPNAVWRHRQPPLHHLRPCRPVQASNSLISQLASRVAAVRSTPPRRESTLGAESRLCCHHMRLQLPPPHRDAIFEHPSGLALHSPWHCLFALEPWIDARPQDVPNLIYEPRSAMVDAWMGFAGFPCDRNVLTTPTAASQTRDAGGNQPSVSAHGAFGAGHGSHRQSTRAKQRLFGPVLSPVPRPVSPGRACPASKRGVRSADGRQRIKKAARSGTLADSPPSLCTSHEPLTK